MSLPSFSLSALAVAAALLAAGAPHAAQAAPAGVPVAVVVSSAQPPIHVIAANPRSLGSAEFAEMRGEYRLSTGGVLAVGGARHRPVAELGAHPPMPLVPAGANRLVSADGRVRLEFDTRANGEVTGLVLTVPPGLL